MQKLFVVHDRKEILSFEPLFNLFIALADHICALFWVAFIKYGYKVVCLGSVIVSPQLKLLMWISQTPQPASVSLQVLV